MMLKKSLIPVSALILLLISAAAYGAGNSAISVDYSKIIADVKPESIRGMNVNNSMMIAKIIKKIRLMNIPVITYPAGNIGDQQNENPFDSASYSFFHLQQSMLQAPFTFSQIRVYNSSAEKAVQTVYTALSNKVRVDVWSIGNEPDLYDKTSTPWTPDKYNKIYREYVTAMKKADPSLKFAGPLVSKPKDDWITSFIKENGDIVDVLSWHWYPTDGSASDDIAVSTTYDITNQITRYRAWLKDPEMNPKGYKRDIKLALSEYAIHWNTQNPAQLTEMSGAVWTAEVLGYMALYGIDYSLYYCLGAYGAHAIFEADSYVPRPVYYVFPFYASHFGSRMAYAASADPEVKAFAGIDADGGKHLILINDNPSAVKQLEISPEGISGGVKSVKGYLLSKDSNGKDMDPKSIAITGKKISLSLPPYSVAAFDLE